MLNDFDSSENVGLRTDFWHDPEQLQIGKLATHHVSRIAKATRSPSLAQG